MRLKEVFIDTNILFIGALNIHYNKQSDESDILLLVKNGVLKMVVNLKLLEEIFQLGKRIVGKDFAGWLRFLIFTDLKPRVILKEEYEQLMEKYKNRIPKEDLEHYACIKSQNICLISENREFLKRAKGVKAYTCKEFLAKLKKSI